MYYADFILQFSSSGADRYVVEVPQAAQGQASRVLDFPFSPDELETLGRSMERQARPPRAPEDHRDVTQDPSREGSDLTSREIGGRLFRALLPDGIRSIYDAELALARQKRHGLRLKVKIDLSRPELLPLYNLPWELLYNPGNRDFLGLSHHTPIVRFLDVERPESTIKRPRKLRILIVMASPEGSRALDLEREADELQKALRGHGNIEVDVLPHASREALNDKLQERPFQILHFMGHGALRRGEGYLLFETSEKQPARFNGDTLAQDLKELESLQLVVLNACHTADAPSDQETSPFEGVATALIQGGIPAVVGMRYPISDRAAIAFSKAFYKKLTTREPIEAAVTAGRRAIHRLDGESLEWAKPILFLRSQSSEIWPSRAWSLAKKIARITAVALFASLLGFLWSRPAIRNYLKLNFTPDGRMAVQQAAAYWPEKLRFCEGSPYALFGARHGKGEPSPYTLYQIKGLRWRVEPLDLPDAARLEGVEYLARSTAQLTGYRTAPAPKAQWSAWTYPQTQPFAPTVVLSKLRGQWRADTSSPYVPGSTNSGMDDLLPLDCGWLQGGNLIPTKLKPLWADAGADLQKGDLQRAEEKILLGLAWIPGDPELLLNFANLRLTQSNRETDPEKKGRLRHEAYEAALTAIRNDAAHRPDRNKILANLMVLEGIRKWSCSQVEHGGNIFLGGFAGILREAGACE